MSSTPIITEADILDDIIGPELPQLFTETAQYLPSLKFSPTAIKQIRGLLRKNNSGKISPEKRATLDKHLRVGQLMDLLQAKIRLSLQEAAKKH